MYRETADLTSLHEHHGRADAASQQQQLEELQSLYGQGQITEADDEALKTEILHEMRRNYSMDSSSDRAIPANPHV